MINNSAPKGASDTVVQENAWIAAQLPFADTADFADADRGFIGAIESAEVRNERGETVWSFDGYEFLNGESSPATVNPSLWRQSRLNMRHGLFEVCERLYQVRGYDLANMTIVETREGIVIIDTLTSAEGARASLELYYRHRGRRPLKAVIYTHSHPDHYGGTGGVISEDEVRTRSVPIIAPNLFMEAAVAENVLAANANFRRAGYQFGHALPRGHRGHVDCGLGKTTQSGGTVTLIAPTDLVRRTGETRHIDGMEFVFQMAPDSEAPAEFHVYIPELRVLNLAENACHTFHNLLPFRGASVRNPKAWSGYLNEALKLWGDEAEIIVAQHHWPTWGRTKVRQFLIEQRDIYKYVHDQTVRHINHGRTPSEIVALLKLPASLESRWHLRGYYGHLRHNIRAIYQKTLGWYDGNPANLDPLTPRERGAVLVEYMGGASAVLERASRDFRNGQFKRVVEVLHHVVFADARNTPARELLADAYEQLGYLSESATWRNSYLMAALELRNGPAVHRPRPIFTPATAASLTLEQIFDFVAISLNGDRIEGLELGINLLISDTGEKLHLNLSNSALTTTRGHHSNEADETITMLRGLLDQVLIGVQTAEKGIAEGKIVSNRDGSAFKRLLGAMDKFERGFPIVEPSATAP